MTWTYSIASDGSSMSVYDHTGTKVGSITNDGTGFDIPGDIHDVMADEIDAAVSAGNITRAVEIARDGSTFQIEEIN